MTIIFFYFVELRVVHTPAELRLFYFFLSFFSFLLLLFVFFSSFISYMYVFLSSLLPLPYLVHQAPHLYLSL